MQQSNASSSHPLTGAAASHRPCNAEIQDLTPAIRGPACPGTRVAGGGSMTKPAARVLVADVPEQDEKIRECLPEHDLTFVRTMVEAVRELRRDGYEVIVIGLHFDESRMFELLSYVRSLPKYDDTPVLCVQGLELHVSEAIRKNIDMAVKAL